MIKKIVEDSDCYEYVITLDDIKKITKEMRDLTEEERALYREAREKDAKLDDINFYD